VRLRRDQMRASFKFDKAKAMLDEVLVALKA
jgi:hypothetical protein